MAKICFVISNPKEIYEKLKSQNMHHLCSYTVVTPGAYKFFINYNTMEEAALISNFINTIDYNVDNVSGWQEMKLLASICLSVKPNR